MPTSAKIHRPIARGQTHRIARETSPIQYGGAWRKARADFLARHPLCVHCKAEGRVTAATVVDHITPHRGNLTLFWNVANWQALCTSHHSIKTASEDGAFGNARKGGEAGQKSLDHIPVNQ